MKKLTISIFASLLLLLAHSQSEAHPRSGVFVSPGFGFSVSNGFVGFSTFWGGQPYYPPAQIIIPRRHNHSYYRPSFYEKRLRWKLRNERRMNRQHRFFKRDRFRGPRNQGFISPNNGRRGNGHRHHGRR